MNNLLDIWKDQPSGYLAVSSKTGTQWKDYFFRSASEVESWVQNHRSDSDLYFCTTTLKDKRRVKENVQASRYLWQDLDAVNPGSLPDNLRPTIAWESSPNRFQALWKLNTLYSASDIEKLNQSLAYAVKADKGSWILTKVLRIPGTLNFKYPTHPTVKLLWSDGPVYTFKELQNNLPGTATAGKDSSEDLDRSDTMDGRSIRQILKENWPRLTTRVKNLLTQRRAIEGKRSDILWYLEHEMVKAGIGLSDIRALVKDSAWNKYKGRKDEDERLDEELARAFSDEGPLSPKSKKQSKLRVGIKVRKSKGGSQNLESEPAEETDEEELPLVSMKLENDSDLLSNMSHYPGWLVEGFWTRKSHGIVSGEPKSFKSTIVMDLAISIASGKPFLGKFTVVERGPVLIVQNENAAWIMKDRLIKIRGSRDLLGKIDISETGEINVTWAPELPIYYINQQGFMFTDPAHREIVEKIMTTIKPKLVIFDPMYLMFDGDLNQAKDLSPTLNWLLSIKEKHSCSVIVIHHWRKNTAGSDTRAGQRMLGSTTLHGWVESAWYLQVNTDKKEASIDQDVDETLTGEPEKANGGQRQRSAEARDGRTVVNDDQSQVNVDTEFNRPNATVNLTLEREFRGAGTYPKIDLSIKMGDFGSSVYQVEVLTHTPNKEVRRRTMASREDYKYNIIHFLETHKRASLREIGEEVGLSRKKADILLREIYEERKRKLPEVKE